METNEAIVLAVLTALYVYALIVTAWKRRWGWLVAGVLLILPAFVGAFLEPEDGSGWPRASNALKLGLPVSLVGAAAVIGVAIGGPSAEESAALDKLKPKTEEYAAATGTATPGTPKLSGRIVPINSDEDEIDEGVYIHLPGELQASSPEDVGTVVLIDYEQKVVGQYQDGSNALQDVANLTIVDLNSGQQFQGKTIAGLEPEFAKFNPGSEQGGPVDRGDIANYLAHLPH